MPDNHSINYTTECAVEDLETLMYCLQHGDQPDTHELLAVLDNIHSLVLEFEGGKTVIEGGARC